MRNQSNFMLRLASILFICVLVTTYMLTGLLARYTSSGNGDDDARVATFEVLATQTPNNINQEITDDVEQTYQIVLTNNSEVAVRCNVDIILEEALPDYYTVKLDGKNPAISLDKKTLSFTSVKDLAVGPEEDMVNLTVNLDYEKWTKSASNSSYTENFKFTTQVTFVQID